MECGEALARRIREHEPPAGGLSFWWLGQHSVVLKLAGRVIYLDPYLSESPRRQTPVMLRPEQVDHAHFVLCSHDHGDHIDPGAIPGIAAASEKARFVAPHPARERMLALGVSQERLVGLDDGQVLETDGLRITAIKAAHEFFDPVPGVGHPYLGYVIEAGDCAVYHSGDTLCYEGLLTRLWRWDLAAMFVPINGRDAVRYRAGCIGNMTYQEAVDLAGHLAPGLVVPTHYDMFANNCIDPRLFADYLEAKYPGQAYWLGEPGITVDVACPAE